MPKDSQKPRAKVLFEVVRKGTGRRTRRGSASPLLLTSLAILLAAGVAAWFLVGQGRPTAPTEPLQPGPAAGTDGPAEPPPGMMREADLIAMEANGPRTVGGLETRPVGGYEKFEKVFGDTGGTVTGEIRVEGAEYPDTWTVTLEPSMAAQGREEAVTRTFTSEPGMRTFELRDLPLAAYRLSAQAPGLATSKIELSLYRVADRPNLRGLDFVTVDLTLRPMAKVQGFVRQANGDPATELAVYLVPHRQPHSPGDTVSPDAEADTEEEGRSKNLQGTTNSAGSFVFDGVPPGAWVLHVGDPLHSLTSPIPLGMGLMDQRLDDLTLPELAELELVVIDYLARPCPDVDLKGYLRGNGSGHFKAKTDATGRIRLRYLTPGPWRVMAEDHQLNQKGQGDFVLTPEGPADGRVREIHIR